MERQREQLKKELDSLKQESVESRAEVRSKLDHVQRDLAEGTKGKLVIFKINHKKASLIFFSIFK